MNALFLFECAILLEVTDQVCQFNSLFRVVGLVQEQDQRRTTRMLPTETCYTRDNESSKEINTANFTAKRSRVVAAPCG